MPKRETFRKVIDYVSLIPQLEEFQCQAMLGTHSLERVNFNLAITMNNISQLLNQCKRLGIESRNKFSLHYDKGEYAFTARLEGLLETTGSPWRIVIEPSNPEFARFTISLHPESNMFDDEWGYFVTYDEATLPFQKTVTEYYALALQCLAGELRKRVREHEGEVA